MTKLPKHIAQYAKQIAVMNPVFDDWKAARRELKRCHTRLVEEPDLVAITTGGFMLRRDGEGDIELWISPDTLWKGKH